MRVVALYAGDTAITKNGQHLSDNSSLFEGYSPVAAESDAGTNVMLQDSAGYSQVWEFDPSWNFTGTRGVFSDSTIASYDMETLFDYDINADGTVGSVNVLPTGSVTISGIATEGEVLTADTSTLADEDGLGPLSYQWSRDGSDIDGAISFTYTLTQADVGAAIAVAVSYTDGEGTSESVASSGTDTVSNANGVPTLGALSDVNINENDPEQTVLLAGITAGGVENQPLLITAVSDNTSLIPDPTVNYTSPDSTGSLTFTAVADQSGTATITVTVEDGGLDNDFATQGDNDTVLRTVTVNVAPVNAGTDVSFNSVSGVLTVTFDDASDDTVSLAITSTGYESTGANVSSGTGSITQLIVTDVGTAKTSSFSLTEASQVLSGGVSVAPQVDEAVITSAVDTGGGAVAIDSSSLTLAADITSGSASQAYGGNVLLAADVNVTTSTGVAGDIQIHFQGTVDSDGTPRTLNVKSESIKFDGDVGGQSTLEDFGGQTVNDSAERGQFYSSVTTDGLQSYKAGTSSGDVEFNGIYTAGGDIELLGEGTFGVVLSLAGDTTINVGTGEFSVQKGSSPIRIRAVILSAKANRLTSQSPQATSLCLRVLVLLLLVLVFQAPSSKILQLMASVLLV